MQRARPHLTLVVKTTRNLGIGVETKKKIETIPKDYLYFLFVNNFSNIWFKISTAF